MKPNLLWVTPLDYRSHHFRKGKEFYIYRANIYRDSQALLDHHKNLGDTMAAILGTCSGSGEIRGTPSPELIEQLKGSPVQV